MLACKSSHGGNYFKLYWCFFLKQCFIEGGVEHFVLIKNNHFLPSPDPVAFPNVVLAGCVDVVLAICHVFKSKTQVWMWAHLTPRSSVFGECPTTQQFLPGHHSGASFKRWSWARVMCAWARFTGGVEANLARHAWAVPGPSLPKHGGELQCRFWPLRLNQNKYCRPL